MFSLLLKIQEKTLQNKLNKKTVKDNTNNNNNNSKKITKNQIIIQG